MIYKTSPHTKLASRTLGFDISPVPATFVKAQRSRALLSKRIFGINETDGRVSGVSLSVLTLDPARVNREELECSDLSPLARKDALFRGILCEASIVAFGLSLSKKNL